MNPQNQRGPQGRPWRIPGPPNPVLCESPQLTALGANADPESDAAIVVKLEKRLKLQQRAAEYFDALAREAYRHSKGGAFPSIVYPFSPPFLFDCRFTKGRRMGIGDQMCLLSAIQKVDRLCGGGSVRIWYDPAFPASTELFTMAGLPTDADSPDLKCPPGFTFIPCRNHIFDSVIGSRNCGYYAEQEECPVSECFYSWGWHKLLRGYPVCLGLYPDKAAVDEARAISRECAPFVTATPLEVSRHNNHCTADVWRELLRGVDKSQIILFGVGEGEQEEIRAMIEAMHLSHKTRVISTRLQTWKALIDMAVENYTGNNCGMWLSFASRTRTYLGQHKDPTHSHNEMWDYKVKWKCKNIIIINV